MGEEGNSYLSQSHSASVLVPPFPGHVLDVPLRIITPPIVTKPTSSWPNHLTSDLLPYRCQGLEVGASSGDVGGWLETVRKVTMRS